MDLFDLGVSLVKIFLCFHIEDEAVLSVAKDISEFLGKIGSFASNVKAKRKMARSLEEIGEKIGQDYEDTIKTMFPDDDVRERISNLLIDCFSSFSINSQSLRDMHYDPTCLSKYLLSQPKISKELRDYESGDREKFESLVLRGAYTCVKLYYELPELSSKRWENLFEEINELKGLVNRVLVDLRNIDEKSKSNGFEVYAREYNKWIRTKYKKVKLFGAEVYVEEKKEYDLSTSYVQLKAEIRSNNSACSQTIYFGDLFSEGRKNVWISGAPGSGKTTCLAWLVSKLAAFQQGEQSCVAGLSNVIPILIELREFKSGDISINDYFHKIMTQSSYREVPQGWPEEQIEKGHFLFMLDGFDEIAENKRKKYLTGSRK